MSSSLLAATALTEALERSGLTQAQLAERAGVSRALVRNYLRGAHQPSVPQLDRLLRAAGQQLEVTVRPLQWHDPGAGPKRRRTPEEQGRALVDVLDLADAIPVRRRTELRFPPFRQLAAR